MKKAVIIFIFILSIISIRCEKCATCTTTTICTGDYKTSTTFDACGSEIDDVNGKTISSTVTVSGITVTCTARTVCN